MSEEVAERKKQEIEELQRRESEANEAIKKDSCPFCKTPTQDYPYVVMLPNMGWVECPMCGIVFSPLSIRRIKLRDANEHNLRKGGSTIQVGMG